MNPSWLLAYDFSAQSDIVLEKVVEEVQNLKGVLHVVFVYNATLPPSSFGALGSEGVFASNIEYSEAIAKNAESRLKETISKIAKQYPALKIFGLVREGTAAEEIVEAAKELKVDRVVLGTHSRHGIGRALLGSVAERVVRTSPVSVLVVKTHA